MPCSKYINATVWMCSVKYSGQQYETVGLDLCKRCIFVKSNYVYIYAVKTDWLFRVVTMVAWFT